MTGRFEDGRGEVRLTDDEALAIKKVLTKMK